LEKVFQDCDILRGIRGGGGYRRDGSCKSWGMKKEEE
jgi:hypothetical protein